MPPRGRAPLGLTTGVPRGGGGRCVAQILGTFSRINVGGCPEGGGPTGVGAGCLLDVPASPYGGTTPGAPGAPTTGPGTDSLDGGMVPGNDGPPAFVRCWSPRPGTDGGGVGVVAPRSAAGGGVGVGGRPTIPGGGGPLIPAPGGRGGGIPEDAFAFGGGFPGSWARVKILSTSLAHGSVGRGAGADP